MRKLYVVALALVVACGGVSEDDLAAALGPIDEAQDQLERFQNLISAGMTYGDLLAEWPGISADVAALLEDAVDAAEVGAIADWPDEDRAEYLSYATAVIAAHDSWAQVHEAVRAFIRDDAPEGDVNTRYDLAATQMDRLDDLRKDALVPGPGGRTEAP